jgi:peptidoglycan hydrolase-like protein with peptidoglycan-binding domain
MRVSFKISSIFINLLVLGVFFAPGFTLAVEITCPVLTRSLYLGLRDEIAGGQVSELQKFLAKDQEVYPEGLVTGYYGRLTEKAVQRWQAKYGVISSGGPAVTGYGVVGPKTRAKISAVCKSALAAPISTTEAGGKKSTLASSEITVLKLSAAPYIDSITPISGAAGTQFTISGKGFTPTNNIIKFGAAYIGEANSDAVGTKIVFTLPYQLTLCEPNKLVCISQQIPLTAGDYKLKVINANGESNDVNVNVK